ncbi:MAG: hypothetical protein M0R80_13435 [Proteobacteria bacterium]|jgi:hypothetical protein|nr:hypothetical protein [Pseudomonadota bacterium]
MSDYLIFKWVDIIANLTNREKAQLKRITEKINKKRDVLQAYVIESTDPKYARVANLTIEEAVQKLCSCPICGCPVGILITPAGHYQIKGYHNSECYINEANDPIFLSLEELVRRWNYRENLHT